MNAVHRKELIIYSETKKNIFLRFITHPLGLVLTIGHALIIAFLIVYLSTPKTYKSSYSLVIPTAGSSSKVSLDEVGQVSQSSTSAFGNQSYSPLANYKQILLSQSVRKSVADRIGIDRSQIVSPKVKILQQTSILDIQVSSQTAELAKESAWAIYEEFQLELTRLRVDEAARHETSVGNLLSQYRKRLNDTRNAIVDFQQRSLLITTSQLEKNVNIQTKLKDDLTFAKSERESLSTFVRRLSNHLGVSPELAGHALSLQSDAEFGAYLSELTTATALLSQFISQWGDNHPKVISEKQRYNHLLNLLHQRSEDIVGTHSARILHTMNLNTAQELTELFSSLLDAGAKLKGLDAKIEQLVLAQTRINDELRVLSREYAELERLEREHQRAEAIYNAAAAKFEQGKTDIFSSYPLVQLLSHPTLPEAPSSPRSLYAVVIGLSGLFFIYSGVLILWQRERLLRVLLKRD